MTNDPTITIKMFEQSLRDLKTDFIDAYFVHWPDKEIDIRRPVEALQKQKERGRIRHIGLCNSNLQDYYKASEVSDIDILQSEFNLFNNGFGAEIMEMAIARGVQLWGWGTLDKGIISGSVKPSRIFEKVDCRSWAPWWKKSNKRSKNKADARGF